MLHPRDSEVFATRFRSLGRGAGVAFLLVFGLVLASCNTTQKQPKNLLRARFHVEAPSDGYASDVILPVSGARISVDPKGVISEFDYLAIDVVQLELGKCLAFTLKPAAARDFFRVTVGRQGYRLVLLLNGRAMGVRQLSGALSDGRIYMYVESSDAHLEDLAKQLKETNIAIQKMLSKAG